MCIKSAAHCRVFVSSIPFFKMNFHSFGQYTGRAGPNNSQYFNPMMMAPLFVPNPLALQQHLSLQHNILSQQILFQQMMMMRDDILWRGLPHPSSSALSQHDNDNRLDTNDASGLLVIQSSAPKVSVFFQFQLTRSKTRGVPEAKERLSRLPNSNPFLRATSKPLFLY